MVVVRPMRVPNASSLLLDLINKARSWIPGASFSVQSGIMSDDGFPGCKLCGENLESNRCGSYLFCCRTCSQTLCRKCSLGSAVVDLDGSKRPDSEGVVRVKQCSICTNNRDASDLRKKNSEKIHPGDIPEPPSPCSSGSEKIDNLVNSESIRSRHLAGFMESRDNIGANTDGESSVGTRLSTVLVHYTPSWLVELP